MQVAAHVGDSLVAGFDNDLLWLKGGLAKLLVVKSVVLCGGWGWVFGVKGSGFEVSGWCPGLGCFEPFGQLQGGGGGTPLLT